MEKEWPGSAQAALQSRSPCTQAALRSRSHCTQAALQSRSHCTQAVRRAKADHIQYVLDATGTDSRRMFSVVDSLLGNNSSSTILPELTDQCAASTLCAFFEEKIQTIWTGLEADENSSEYQPSFFVVENLSEFSPVIEDQLAKTISNCKPTSLSVDPIPTKIVLDCLDVLPPVLVNIINSSLHSAMPLKTAVIKHLLKKNGLDPNQCYRPVSNLPHVSKLLKRVVTVSLPSKPARRP